MSLISKTAIINVTVGATALIIGSTTLTPNANADTNTQIQTVAQTKLASKITKLQTNTQPNQDGGSLQYEFHSNTLLENPTVYIKLPDTINVKSVTVNGQNVQTEQYDLDGDNVLIVPATENKDIIVKVNGNNITGTNTSTYAFLQSESLADATTDDIHYDEGSNEQNHTFMHILGAFELPYDSVIGTKNITNWDVQESTVDSQSLGFIRINGILSGKDSKGKIINESLDNTTQWIGTELTVEKHEENGKVSYDAPNLINIIESFKNMSEGYDIDYDLNKESGILTLSYTIKDSTLNESEFVENSDGTTETYMSKFNKLANKTVHLRNKTNTVKIDLAKYYDHIKEEKTNNPEATEFSSALKDVVTVNNVKRSILPSKNYDFKHNPYGINTNNIVLTWNLDKC